MAGACRCLSGSISSSEWAATSARAPAANAYAAVEKARSTSTTTTRPSSSCPCARSERRKSIATRAGLGHERLRALQQFLEPRLVRVPWLAGVDDCHLARFCGLDHFLVRAGVQVLDEGLLVAVVAEHLVVDVLALVAARAANRFDPRLVRRR